jgi:diketogulonate reductase-like aldo/keto reductase
MPMADGGSSVIRTADRRLRVFVSSTLEELAAERDAARAAIDQLRLAPVMFESGARAHLPQEVYHAEHGILTEAWSPIGRGRGLLEDQTIIRLAAEKQRSPAQVVLRWHMQLGNIAIPKSVTPARIRQNIDIFDFTLDEDEMRQLNRLATGEWIGPDPDTDNTF